MLILILDWADIESVDAFIASPNFAAYFETLGIEEPARFHAFFIPEPSIISTSGLHALSGKIITHTMSFHHPVDSARRDEFNGAKGIQFPTYYGNFRSRPAWVNKPQLGPDGQLIDIGVITQLDTLPEHDTRTDFQNQLMCDDQIAREEWARYVIDVMEPLQSDEVMWDFGCGLLSRYGLNRQMGIITIRPRRLPLLERTRCWAT